MNTTEEWQTLQGWEKDLNFKLFFATEKKNKPKSLRLKNSSAEELKLKIPSDKNNLKMFSMKVEWNEIPVDCFNDEWNIKLFWVSAGKEKKLFYLELDFYRCQKSLWT